MSTHLAQSEDKILFSKNNRLGLKYNLHSDHTTQTSPPITGTSAISDEPTTEPITTTPAQNPTEPTVTPNPTAPTDPTQPTQPTIPTEPPTPGTDCISLCSGQPDYANMPTGCCQPDYCFCFGDFSNGLTCDAGKVKHIPNQYL